MQFIINEEEFKKKYVIDKKNIKHKQPSNIIILPYVTGYVSADREQIEKFSPCIGEFCRLMYNKKISSGQIKPENIDIFLDSIDIDSNYKVTLKRIIKELFFDENENIYIFHPKLLNYIHTPNVYYMKLSKFLYDVLLNDMDNIEIKKKVNDSFKYDSYNVMELLMLKSLPELETVESSKSIYRCVCKNVSNLFKEDLEFILSRPELITTEFEKLLKYYYFFYVSQLSMKLSDFFICDKNKTEELYFILDWEKVSKSRKSYRLGWKMLESHIKPLFSHVHTLEILNTNDSTIKYDYEDLNKIINSLSDIEKDALYESIKKIKNIYVSSINDVQWDQYETQVEKYKGDNIKKEIYDLYRSIDYQFNNSGRKGKYKNYKSWFEEYCKLNFLRKVGSLGNMLNINQEQLLFITKLCIKKKSKMRVRDLFKEYKKRGIYFDRESQLQIVELFEKLNVIEKKSDSGDAQYVKSIL
ncbi:DNA phosphorothioation-dependent restriction protein DptG [Clostridioides sp. ES-S-0049-02]|uniref:DNA phosphorothioation-dependent restriction protein DptG n=1 Tax=Clostridioides sp. ES-S-0049-02 TaxID=2770778 RepID=UPI001D114EBA|nr:DNA phosphorothioation-dependent restriction protein DptG [Clostridioides sp. ES-S-0049-02]